MFGKPIIFSLSQSGHFITIPANCGSLFKKIETLLAWNCYCI
jgi:hypothetical protein